jgi:hypothetical protein
MTTTLVKGKQISQAHGTFYSSVTQAIANVANFQVIALEKTGDILYLTHDNSINNSRIYVPWNGSYEIIFSGIADLSSAPGNKHLEIWFAIGGTPVPDSNTRVEIPSASIEQTVVVSAILDIDAGDYVELITWGDSTNCRWLATAVGADPVRPAVPSVIVTIKCVNAYSEEE